jgi:plasmid stability protein
VTATPAEEYVDGLATQLRCRHAVLLHSTEDELQKLRGQLHTVARFISNQAIALDIRQGLAQDLHLPTPEK